MKSRDRLQSRKWEEGISSLGAGEVDWWVRCFSCKDEDLHSIPRMGRGHTQLRVVVIPTGGCWGLIDQLAWSAL